MSEISRFNSRYAPASVGVGIVHIGLGAFHRAHQAVYIERWLNRHGGGDWGICAANIRSNKALVEQLNAQQGQYHVAEYQDSSHVSLREVNAIRDFIFAGEDVSVLLQRLVAPQTRIVTLTVTEKGYYLVPAEQRLRLEDPAIAHDIAHPQSPQTAPGILLEALRQRRAKGVPAFAVLCCDNMPDNGLRTRQAVIELAQCHSAELAEWIRTEVAFPCSMVDRIVPAMTEESRQALARELDCQDPAAVVCEAFSQWVVEDHFPLGRPDWEAEGVQMVADVSPFETMKLRLLNGSHSLLAYVGLLGGWHTVAEAVADPAMEAMLRLYMCDEAAPTLSLPDDVDVAAYAEQLLARFANDSLKHRLAQIAMDGSQKLPQRWLQGAQERLAQGGSIRATALGVAAWMHHVSGSDLQGNPHAVDDPQAARFEQLHAIHATPQARVDALLKMRELFPEALATDTGFRQAVLRAYLRLEQEGVGVCLSEIAEAGLDQYDEFGDN
jgi:fructuronate reductase